MISDLAKRAATTSASGATPELASLAAAVEHLVATLDQRKAAT